MWSCGLALACAAGCTGQHEPDQLQLERTSIEMPVGVDATVDFFAGDTNERSFVLGNTGIALVEITDTGVDVLGLAPGGTTIQVEDNGLWGSIHVSVTPPIYKDIYLEPADFDMTVGDELAIQCVAVFTDATAFDVTTDCEWSSDTPDVATFETGLVKAHGSGTAKIRAFYLDTEFVAEIVVR